MNRENQEQPPEMSDLLAQQELQKVFDWFQQNVSRLELAYNHLEVQFNQVKEELDQKTHALQKASIQNNLIQENLNALLNSMKPGVVMVDEHLKVTVVNQSAEKLLDLDAQECENLPLDQILPAPNALREVLLNAMENPLNMVEAEKRVVLKDTVNFPASIKGSAILGYEERVIGVVVTFTDMTNLKKMEEEIQQHKILSALGEMAATVAHEIRNPLGGIGGYAGLLARDLESDDPRRRLVDKIIQGVSSLNKIVSNLLYYTRKTETRMIHIDLIDFIEGVLSYVHIEIEKSGKAIELSRRWEFDRLEVDIDPEKMQQVLLNLLLNAIQAIEVGGIIEVSIRQEGNDLIVEIFDSGKGMDEETIRQIFNPFFTTKEQGTGLGLAIVKKIIDLHHGQIFVESSQDSGTLFRIFLPK